ncbi:hypothetical protein A1O3_03977 [Capronia epimyces CBS 606.96]|uniref:Methyltransferase domain-containing protein n=1 Tax=Capronia epimyces CBS 606.96 TaxID=1182542 RepID=W9YBJ0_9EURO|nr:uncharacterized protein A1O3_03977 [Capronia epimyces CBS 606.96]EXJ87020.1 hypothetical protein A1O3_03977 [Capronia epimyces CBS 606.96]
MTSAALPLQPTSGNDRFNAEAASWETNPFVHEASKEALKAIMTRFPALTNPPAPDKGLEVLEIGCGTGLLSCLIAPYAKRVVAVDAAPGMIEELEKKLQTAQTPQNILPVAVLLENPEDKHLPPVDESNPDGPRLKFDLIISHLTLHHVSNLRAVLTTMLGCLKHSGSVALTDFEDNGPEAKRFHEKAKMAGVQRPGINAQAIDTLMNEVGFVNVRVERAWSMDKVVEKYDGEFGDAPKGPRQPGQGEIKSFPFLVCTGQKKYCQ